MWKRSLLTLETPVAAKMSDFIFPNFRIFPPFPLYENHGKINRTHLFHLLWKSQSSAGMLQNLQVFGVALVSCHPQNVVLWFFRWARTGRTLGRICVGIGHGSLFCWLDMGLCRTWLPHIRGYLCEAFRGAKWMSGCCHVHCHGYDDRNLFPERKGPLFRHT